MIEVHSDSPLGRLLVRLAELETKQEAAHALVDRRQEEVAATGAELAALSPLADLETVTDLVVKELGQARRVGLATRVRDEHAGDLARARAAISELEKRRAQRVESLACLEDENAATPYNPVERRSRSVLEAWRLAVIAGDPEAVAKLREKYESLPPVPHFGAVYDLANYAGEIKRLAASALE